MYSLKSTLVNTFYVKLQNLHVSSPHDKSNQCMYTTDKRKSFHQQKHIYTNSRGNPQTLKNTGKSLYWRYNKVSLFACRLSSGAAGLA